MNKNLESLTLFAQKELENRSNPTLRCLLIQLTQVIAGSGIKNEDQIEKLAEHIRLLISK